VGILSLLPALGPGHLFSAVCVGTVAAGTVLGLCWDCVGTVLGLCWDCVGTVLGLCQMKMLSLLPALYVGHVHPALCADGHANA